MKLGLQIRVMPAVGHAGGKTLGPSVVDLGQIGRQHQGGVRVWQEAAILQGADDEPRADLMVPAHQPERPAEQKEESLPGQGEEPKGLPNLGGGVRGRLLSAFRPKTRADPHKVIFGELVFRDRAALDPKGLRLHHGAALVNHQGAVAPVRVDGIGAPEPQLLGNAYEARDRAAPVGEDEIPRVEPGGILARAVPLDAWHGFTLRQR